MRRPTSLARRPDGKFWLPETGGLLAVFDPAVPIFTYWATPGVFYLSYPWVDADGSVWSSDFVYNSIVHWAPDMSTARVWLLPGDGPAPSAPSKIVRLGGKIWISFYFSSQIGRFDETTGQLDVFRTGDGTNPYDMHEYRGRILYSDQAGQIGFLDPAGSVPTTVTLTPTDATPTVQATYPTAAVTSTLTPVDDAVVFSYLGSVAGVQGSGRRHRLAGERPRRVGNGGRREAGPYLLRDEREHRRPLGAPVRRGRRALPPRRLVREPGGRNR